jgi:hypothetical protein
MPFQESEGFNGERSERVGGGCASQIPPRAPGGSVYGVHAVGSHGDWESSSGSSLLLSMSLVNFLFGC